jgi:hypothetical protein
MAMTTAAATELLNLLFENNNWANIGDATGLVASTADGDFYVSLHTADPTASGDQTSNEATYTGYQRIAVARNTGWTVSGANVSNTAAVGGDGTWDCTAGSDTITHFGIGTDFSGSGNLILFGALGSSLAVSAGIDPEFAIGALDVDVDTTIA